MNQPDESNLEIAVFGGGCFWCTEAVFQKLRGVSSVTPGYAGGDRKNPTYEMVSMGTTGHAEVVKIIFDPSVITYQELLDIFFVTHDPTTPNAQGNDRGTQYRSIILFASIEQKKLAELAISRLTEHKVFDNPIVTKVLPLLEFYPAEEYHRTYYQKNPDQAYCQLVISPKLAKLREHFRRLVKEE